MWQFFIMCLEVLGTKNLDVGERVMLDYCTDALGESAGEVAQEKPLGNCHGQRRAEACDERHSR